MVMNKFWLFFGIFLSCSGIGTALGILMILVYIWEDLKKPYKVNKIPESLKSENMTDSDDVCSPKSKSMNFYNQKTQEDMK